MSCYECDMQASLHTERANQACKLHVDAQDPSRVPSLPSSLQADGSLLQSMAADMLMNMDLDFEALGGKRLIPLPSLRNLESQLKEDGEHSAESSTENSMAGIALHRLGQGAALSSPLSLRVPSSSPNRNPAWPLASVILLGLIFLRWRPDDAAPCFLLVP